MKEGPIGRARAGPLPPPAGGAVARPTLRPGEALVAERDARLTPADALGRPVGSQQTPDVRRCGALYVTNRRIIHVASSGVLVFELDDIEDASLAGDQLLLVTRTGDGVAIQTPLLRQLYLTIAALRAERQASAR